MIKETIILFVCIIFLFACNRKLSLSPMHADKIEIYKKSDSTLVFSTNESFKTKEIIECLATAKKTPIKFFPIYYLKIYNGTTIQQFYISGETIRTENGITYKMKKRLVGDVLD